MSRKQYFHLCANGEDARNFIVCRKDYLAAINIVALCAANSEAVVTSFSLEDTHPHFLIYGSLETCTRFKNLFETTYRHYAAETREGGTGFRLHVDLYPIGEDLRYLRNVAVYTIIQPTKDGKHVMPYDYLWGTGCLYFRTSFYTPVWLFNPQGEIVPAVPFSSFSKERRREMIHSRTYTLPDEWLVSNGIVLPSNYVDVAGFEAIYQTPNCFRVYLSNNRRNNDEILQRMAQERGVALEDDEARQRCAETCKTVFGTRDPRRLDAQQRIILAQNLRRKYKLSYRQLATVVRLPEIEVRRYVMP